MSSNPTTTPYFESLTQDLVTEILVKLPVKSLLRCKSVSKPWLSLISNPNFINSQLKHTLTKPGADQTLIVNGGGRSMTLFHLDSCEIGVPLGDFSFLFGTFFNTAGSCNGIVCFWHAPDFSRINNPSTYLWNPATKQAKRIPPHNIHFDNIMSFTVGFGFDPIGNDYKVVVLLIAMCKPWTAEVYSANINVWRRVEPNPKDLPCDDDFDVCVNGFLCCVGLYGMMAFDLNKEVFTCGIKLPERYWPARITDFNDSVAVIGSKKLELNDALNVWTLNVWTLDDEACLCDSGVEASWTLMLSIDVGRPVDCIFGYFNSGDLLLLTEDGRTLKYNESLVSITGFKQVTWNACEDDD